MKSYRAVLFDLDGTLIDSFEGIVAIFQDTLAALGHPGVTAQAVREVIGFPLAECFARFLPPAEVDAAVVRYRAIYEQRMHDISPPMPGAVALLEALRGAGVATGIVSNKRGTAVRSILARKGWPLDIIVAEGDGHASKPAPDMIVAAAETLGLARGEVLYVGDSALDAAAAQAGGIDFAGVLTGELRSFAGYATIGVYPTLTELQRALLGPKAA